MNSSNSLLSSRTFIYYEADIGVLLHMGKVGWDEKTSLHSIFVPSFVLEQVSPSILLISTPWAKEKTLFTCSGGREKNLSKPI